MELILDGNSDNTEHVWCETYDLISLVHLFTTTAVFYFTRAQHVLGYLLKQVPWAGGRAGLDWKGLDEGMTVCFIGWFNIK